MSRSARMMQRVDASSSTLTAYDKAVLANTPVMYLPLSGGSGGNSDHAGNSHTGTPIAVPTITTMPNGDRATVFDGATQYIEIPDDDALSVTKTGIITIEAWIRPDILEFPHKEGSGYVHWMGKGVFGQNEYACRMYSTTNTETPPRPGRISGYCFNSSGGLGAGSYFQDAVSVGEWIHYVLIINTVNTSSSYPTGYTKVFKDGVQRDQDALVDYSIVPSNGTSPFRIGTIDLNSFFEGAIAKVAVYNYELSATTIHGHYRTIVPPVNGTTGLIKHVGDNSSTTSGTVLTISVPVGGVSAGSTLLAKVGHTYTSGNPSMADSRGNTWTLVQTTPNSGNTMRASLFSASINNALRAGDTIQLTLSAAVAIKAFSVDEFSHVTFSSALDVKNNLSGNSTTPGSATTITTTNADDLVYGFVLVNGPNSEGYTEDSVGEFTGLTRIGTNTGSGDITLNSAYKSVASTGAYKYQPLLGTAESWTVIVASFKGGDPVITPPVTGTANYIQHIDHNSSKTSGTTLTLTVPVGGVPVGHTLIVRTTADYTSTGSTIADSRGNTYTRDRTAANGGSTFRSSIASGRITTALQAGDTITVTWPSSITGRVASADEFSNFLSPTAIDAQNGASGSGTTPSASITTTNANDLIVVSTAVEGPIDETYTEDTIRQWSSMTRVGTTGGTATSNRTNNGAYRSVGATGTYQYSPILGTAENWLDLIVAYKGA